jgi:hypothetical protein
MGLYNFQERFVPFIKDGSKPHTIRAIRKYPQKVGALMHLFFGLRTKYSTRIIPALPCKSVKTIIFYDDGDVFIHPEILNIEQATQFVEITNLHIARRTLHLLDDTDKDELAWRDGFRVDDKGTRKGCFYLMLRWWRQTHELPFAGHIQYWK